MIFFAVLAAATAIAAVVLRGRRPRTAARWGLAAAMIVAGAAHFANPTPFEQHLPEAVPAVPQLIAITGFVEILLGIALFLPGRHDRVGLITAAYLVAIFPANIYVAAAGIDVDGQPGGLYPWARLLFQPLFIAWALWSTRALTAPEGDAPATRGLIPPTPWTRGPARPPRGASTVVLATVFELRSLRDVPAFFAASMHIRSIFRTAPGGVRLSLRAIPGRRTFWTLSQWDSQQALDAFAAHPEHVEVMRRFGPHTAGMGLATWTRHDTRPPRWSDADARIHTLRRRPAPAPEASPTPEAKSSPPRGHVLS